MALKTRRPSRFGLPEQTTRLSSSRSQVQPPLWIRLHSIRLVRRLPEPLVLAMWTEPTFLITKYLLTVRVKVQALHHQKLVTMAP